MFIPAETLDDLLASVFEELLKRPFDLKSTRGDSSEIIGVILEVTNPRARLSRTETKGKPFSALGELFWYLSKKNELRFIEYYIKAYKKESTDNLTVHGGYGPRLFNSQEQYNQIENIIKLLTDKPSSRQAVIQLFEARDIVKSPETNKYNKDIPCTCTLQFFIRKGKLHMVTHMRSNDAFMGLPHDVFAFTMLQEIIARSLNVDLGTYRHSVGSLHLYTDRKSDAEQYIKEGIQPTTRVMPEMPIGDPWPALQILMHAEEQIRLGNRLDINALDINSYWKDLAYLLKVFALTKESPPDYDGIKEIGKLLSGDIYRSYIQQKLFTSQQK